MLDGAKTGLKIKPATLTSDLKAYNSTRGPEWKAKRVVTNAAYTPRGKGEFISGPFIMDTLQRQAKKENDKILAKMDEVFKGLDVLEDPHLVQPWRHAVEKAKLGSPEVVRAKRKDLSKIACHVHDLYREHRLKIQEKFSNLAIETRQDILRELSKQFTAFPTPDDMEVHTDPALILRLRASYAYIYDLEQKEKSIEGVGWSRFPWNMALRELCHIKASATGPYKTVSLGFYDRFKLSRR